MTLSTTVIDKFYNDLWLQKTVLGQSLNVSKKILWLYLNTALELLEIVNKVYNNNQS